MPDAHIWRVTFATLREAPPRIRRASMMVAGNWLLLLTLQLIIDSDDSASRAYEMLELLGVLLGSAGALLLIFVYMLNGSAQESAGAHKDHMVFTRMLVAFPVLAAKAVVLLSASLMAYGARALITPNRGDVIFHLAIALLLLAGIMFALRLIRDSVTFLHGYAAEQSELAATAATQASQAELRALQAQMNPHFLFNALNTVAALVRTDARAAERTVENLADVLRRTLQRSATVHGTVREEVEYLRAYLAIEQERRGDRLRVEWDVADDTLGRALPPLSLQPLVENALQHAVDTQRAGGTIRISAHMIEDALQLEVSDDGEGFVPGYREGTGIGNLRRRLSTLYGDDSSFAIHSTAHGSVCRIIIKTSAGTSNG